MAPLLQASSRPEDVRGRINPSWIRILWTSRGVMTPSRTRASRLRSNRRGASGGQSCGLARIGSGARTDSGAGCAGAGLAGTAAEGIAPPPEAGAKGSGAAPWAGGTDTGASREPGGTIVSGWACTKGMLAKGSSPREVRASNRWEGLGAMG